jgi:Ca2+/H+ antiporter
MLISLAVLRDFHEDIADEQMNNLLSRFDTDNDGFIDYDEFISACYVFIREHETLSRMKARKLTTYHTTEGEIASNLLGKGGEEDEVEEIPEDFTDLSPEDQQKAIKKRAFGMLTIGTLLVILFSDPMVDVMQEIANRLGLSPFYVSFILAPLASNASEVIASQYYAAKKTRKTITVSLSALEGAASMNNTFCLSIFMGLIYFRGLAWQYSAETIAIVSVQFIIAYMVQRKILFLRQGFMILSIFPLSIAFVATLEAFGLD